MHIGKAFFAGVIGGAASTIIIAIAHAIGRAADLVMLMGTLPGHAPGAATWLLGFLVMMLGAGLIGIAYAAIFESVLRRGGVRSGLLVSTVHMILGGLFLGLLSATHPLVPNVLQSPGFFMSGFGALGLITFVASKLTYGAIVGGLYGETTATETQV